LNNGIPPFIDILAVALSPSSPSTIYAANGFRRKGVFKSTDGGASWVTVNSGLTDADVRVLAVHPNDSAVVYRGDYSVGIARTTDGGARWDLVNGTRGIVAIAINPSSTSTVYAGVGAQVYEFLTTGGLLKTTDGGATWAAAENGLTSRRVLSLAVDQRSPSVLYAGTAPSTFPSPGIYSGVFKSEDGGQTWRPAPFLEPGSVSCFAEPTSACLNGGRFRVEVTWQVPAQGTRGAGTSLPLTGDTAAFWFFSPNNIEIVAKVVDGRAFNGRFWVFVGALSDVEYTVRVTDTVTGAIKNYFNPSGMLASVADTSAF